MMKRKEDRKKTFREIMKDQGKKRTHLLGKTFSKKFFLKLCSNLVDPSVVCFQILSYEPENRTKDDIERASPWLKNLEYFYDFISLKETEDNIISLIKKLTWVINRKVFQRNTIIKNSLRRPSTKISIDGSENLHNNINNDNNNNNNNNKDNKILLNN